MKGKSVLTEDEVMLLEIYHQMSLQQKIQTQTILAILAQPKIRAV